MAVPEFKLVNAITCNNMGNFFRDRVYSNERVEDIQYADQESTNSSNVTTRARDSTRTSVNYDFSTEQSLVTSSAGVERLLERLDLYLCGGTLHPQFKARLRTSLLRELATAGGAGNISTDEAMEIAKASILAVVSSPSFLVTE
jgi:hypothetical protein